MKYKNAQDILPDKLLKELQKYISGETIYIPNIQQKAAWGAVSGAREYIRVTEKTGIGRLPIPVFAADFDERLSCDSLRFSFHRGLFQ